MYKKKVQNKIIEKKLEKIKVIMDKSQGNLRLITKGFVKSNEFVEESYLSPPRVVGIKSTLSEPISTTLVRDYLQNNLKLVFLSFGETFGHNLLKKKIVQRFVDHMD